ncbi:PREDICTED: proline-rich receptor-like protein kinase PERK13 [Camelina sativa]|uniref:Proline-rich receptor-like protein kinase PERK13 n=1 Tax=Camelina sativa TaxID=90675 RepID=A0ABM1QBY4_CAMSA|nr:PREDICTED: proline-rich receptor-like protein kinase PERK13 [Camelina sativa]
MPPPWFQSPPSFPQQQQSYSPQHPHMANITATHPASGILGPSPTVPQPTQLPANLSAAFGTMTMPDPNDASCPEKVIPLPVSPILRQAHSPQVDTVAHPQPPPPVEPTPPPVPQVVAPPPQPAAGHSMVTRSKRGITKPKQPLSLHTEILSHLPTSHLKALEDPNWNPAMNEEYDA